MIQPLRTIHRHTFYAMAAVVPIIFFFAISGREPQLQEPGKRPAALRENEKAWPTGVLASSRNGNATITRVLMPLRIPDPLLYCAERPGPIHDLPLDAVLVASIRESETVESHCRGELVLYSLGHGVVADRIPVGDLR